MSRVHGKDSRILLNEYSVSGQANGWSFAHRRNYSDATVLTDDGERWQPGLLAGTVSIKGFVDTDAGLYSETVAALGVDDSVLTTFLPAGYSVGAAALMAVSDASTLETPATVTDVTPLTIEGKPDNGVDMGVCLHTLTAETADSNGTSVDNAAASTNGSVANLHVTAYSGFTSVVLKVQSSTDNSSWSDFITFTTVTALTSERKTTAGSVPRYLRAFWDVTGSGSITFVMAVARR